ncbi:RNA helicase [[Candida] zeylanoides]
MYTASSTSSYMQAMQPMVDFVETLTLPSEKVPQIAFGNRRRQLAGVLERFASVSTAILDDIEDAGSAVQQIERQCRRLGDGVWHSVCAVVRDSPSDEALQSGLLDILGFEQFELMQTVIDHRETIAAMVFPDEGGSEPGRPDSAGPDNKGLHPRAAHQVLERAAKAKAVPLTSTSTQRYPHVFSRATHTDVIPGKAFVLPQGTTRQSYGSHEEIVIPYTSPDTNRWIRDDQLVQIAHLDFLCRGTFGGYRHLNKMQSLIYPVAYNTNENMLVCAPTGAGKTDVALLTILRTIGQFSTRERGDGGDDNAVNIDYDEFKVVYVAPLKALAAEIVAKFSQKLRWLGVHVRELTGDMQLTRQEIASTQVIVTTPEKWDVVTRKQSGDNELVSRVRLLIIDEVHLLHEERGSVIETLVARTLRQVESTQSMIRIVGLSATLPNYMDVADFLGVSRHVGMFYFDQSFRPCPLKQELVGVRGKAGSKVARDNIDRVAYAKLRHYVAQGLQVMVFVHSRKDTAKSAQTFAEMARGDGDADLFDCSQNESYERLRREVGGANRNRELKELFPLGFGVHHAGMQRTDRNLTERLFLGGAIKVLCCTATLAWGVNLPAAVVIVKGTQLYDPKQGFVDLGISDVLQIFGRAGRPQYGEEFGTGILCTTSDKVDHYAALLTQQHPIESRFLAKLVDNLNAEVSLGTVTTVDEAVAWLGYTYMMVRMRKNPHAFGLAARDLENDPALVAKRHALVVEAARRLHSLQMVVYDERTGALVSKDLGRVASDFYLLHTSVEVFVKMMSPRSTLADVLAMVSVSGEFEGMRAREDEKGDLRRLDEAAVCQIARPPPRKAKGPGAAAAADDDALALDGTKTNLLLQAYISQTPITHSALSSDCYYVAQNAARICRALFLIGINRRWGDFSRVMLSLCKSIDRRVWPDDHPMAQFELAQPILRNLRRASMETLRDMEPAELGDFVHNHRMGAVVHRLVGKLPWVDIESEIFPVTANVMRVSLGVEAAFEWDERWHGGAQVFWVMVEEQADVGAEAAQAEAAEAAAAAPGASDLLHVEKLLLHRRSPSHTLDFMIPLSDPLPAQIVVRAVSDSWIGAETLHPISFQHLIRPSNAPVRTPLLRLQPLPLSALHNPDLEYLYRSRFQYFNPMQTMAFHTLYNTAASVFVGSPTGSGKTIVAELAMWQAFRDAPGSKVVYIAPMKALVRERVDDWRRRLCGNSSPLGLRLVELTGDSLPEARDVREADIIVTTPEKFDGISRNWKTRRFVQQVSLVVMDEIHLLASDRGPILEMIVSRMNFISRERASEASGANAASGANTASGANAASGGAAVLPSGANAIAASAAPAAPLAPVRLLGMSTAVANPTDMARWLRAPALFNFSSSVRPVPLQMYIDGFPDNLAFAPLMKTMNKPAFMAIKAHSPDKPVLIFVASRRQTRLTALDLIHLCGMEANPRRFLRGDDADIGLGAKDDTLRLALQFGIGVHHAGLVESDRQLAHRLFEAGKIQILVATSTLAWGVNLPAHLVIIKGTQFFDAKLAGYRDMDLTDILQMMGRAGRPAFDTSGTAIVYTRESKKSFYKHFLNVGFPVESSLHKVLDDHLGAEISAGTVRSRQQAMDFLTWTFLYRRAHHNPTYYGIDDVSPAGVARYLAGLIDSTIASLVESRCVVSGGDTAAATLVPTPFLHISSYYYLSHRTMRTVTRRLRRDSTMRQCLRLLCEASEYDELATRHGEELINMELSQAMRWPASDMECEHLWDPHVKAFLLLQAYMSRVELPIADYAQDTVAVLDHSLRVLQAYVDTAGEMGYLQCVLTLARVMRCVKMRCWEGEVAAAAVGARPAAAPPAPEASGAAAPAVSLKSLGAMTPAQLREAARRFGGDADFVSVASHLPTGDLSVRQRASVLEVEFRHHNEPLTREFRVHCPHFPKEQRESWFVILCDSAQTELLALKRASPRLQGRRGVVRCDLEIPPELPRGEYCVKFVNDAVELEYEGVVVIE